MRHLSEITGVFLKLGLIAFGGPAAHVGLLEEEVVERRQWMTRERFLDLLAATNLIPGPNSTEMVIHAGYHRGGLPGLVLAGVAFVTPALAITTVVAWLYTQQGALPDVEHVLKGIQPAMLAVIGVTAWRLGRRACHSRSLLAVALVSAVATGFGWDPLFSMILAAGIGSVWILRGPQWSAATAALALAARGLWMLGARGGATAAPLPAAADATLAQGLPGLALFFLKIGSVLYGSGYVLFAYLQAGLQQGGPLFGLIDNRQLLDAVAAGQLTPGPVLSTAAFIGYLCFGWQGAVVAGTAIFLPAFVLVAVSSPWIPRLRRLVWAGTVLDCLAAASIGLMVPVCMGLARVAIYDVPMQRLNWIALATAAASVLLLVPFKLSAVWLVVLGGAVGWAAGG